jgi:hypothetical protein
VRASQNHSRVTNVPRTKASRDSLSHRTVETAPVAHGPEPDDRPLRSRTGLPPDPAGLLGLQRSVGNRVVCSLLARTPDGRSTAKSPDSAVPIPPRPLLGTRADPQAETIARQVIRRDDDLDTFVADLKRTGDLTMLAVLLPSWESADRVAAADRLGIERFKELFFALGAPMLGVLKDDLVKGVTLPELGAILGNRGGTIKQILDVGRRWKAPLRERLAAVIEGFAVDIDQLKPVIQVAPKAEREEAAKDRAMLDRARDKLDRDTYLGLLPALGVYNKPNTGGLEEGDPGSAHKTGPEAHKVILEHLQKYLAEAVKAGRTVEGEVAVVDDDDFQLAFDRQWVETKILPAGTDAMNTCNAFVDVNLSKRHIWVHRNLGNEGTVIHEGMHKYANYTLRDEQMALVTTHGGVSQLDEGITEVFTRKVTDALGIDRENYANPFEMATLLEGFVGDTVLAKAYFDGAFPALKEAYDKRRPSGKNWTVLALALEKKDWKLAKKCLT